MISLKKKEKIWRLKEGIINILKRLSNLIRGIFINFYWRNKFNNKFFDIQNSKWSTIPGSLTLRVKTSDLLKLNDQDLISEYEKLISGDLGSYRTFYRERYILNSDAKSILDLGCGLGRDGLFLAELGFKVTFADVINENIDLVKRICKLKKLECKFYKLNSFEDYSKLGHHDLIMAMGSLHHNPKEITKKIITIMQKKSLIPNTKFLILSYPFNRWYNDLCKPFSEWGENTDGWAPWTEYYNKKKNN